MNKPQFAEFLMVGVFKRPGVSLDRSLQQKMCNAVCVLRTLIDYKKLLFSVKRMLGQDKD